MTLPSTIAVDGPAGSGKSSVSFAVAQRIGYLFVDTGAFYRAITLLALEQSIDVHDAAALVAMIHAAHLDMTPEGAGKDRQYTFLAGGRDITHQLHAPQVEQSVSIVSALREVRAAILNAQRALAGRGRVIMAGRDIATVVLPDADLKIYIDASLEQRALRRYAQRLAEGATADLEAIRQGLRQRDEIDSQRAISPLQRAPDALYLDTSDLSLEQSIEATCRLILSWLPPSE